MFIDSNFYPSSVSDSLSVSNPDSDSDFYSDSNPNSYSNIHSHSNYDSLGFRSYFYSDVQFDSDSHSNFAF